MSIKIVDPQTGAELGPGKHGEIIVKGVTFMRGYYKVDPETYLDENGYLHTQDGGYLTPDGELRWTGRLSNMIKTGGANVSPLEIEGALVGCPGVSVGVAVGIPHSSLGEIVVLAAVPAPGERIDEETVRGWLRERLSAYKVPRRVFAFERADLDFTGTQKVQVDPLRGKILERLRAERAEIAGQVYASRA
jgi:acyl-CoA synthetase (AMP-forming)/AMP-acid ligase II